MRGVPLSAGGSRYVQLQEDGLPLVLFGAQGYGARQGLIMMPARIGQAFAPFVFGMLMAEFGTQALWFTIIPSILVVLMLGLLAPAPRDNRQTA